MIATLDTIAELLRDLIEEQKIMRLVYEAHQGGPVAPPDDTEDLKVSFDPKTWKGASCKGMQYSECPPEYLDHVARAMTNIGMQEKEDRVLYKGKPAYVYSLQKAGRARRWALRKRMGWLPPERPKPASFGEATKPAGFGAPAHLGDQSSKFGAPTPFGGAKPAAPAIQIADDSFDFGANATGDGEGFDSNSLEDDEPI